MDTYHITYDRIGLTSRYLEREQLMIGNHEKFCTPFQVSAAQLFDDIRIDSRYRSIYTELCMVPTTKPTKFMQINIATCENEFIAIVQESTRVKYDKFNKLGSLVIFPGWREYFERILSLDIRYYFEIRDLDPRRDI